MTFAPGDEVHVASLGKGIVREVRNGARYVVELKGRSIVAVEQQLTPVTEPKRSASRDADPASHPRQEPQVLRTHAPSSLDLHGITAEGATGALDAFVNDALLAGLAKVRVIHGRSGGRLKAAVHARLKQLPGVRHFRVDPANAGVTIVSF